MMGEEKEVKYYDDVFSTSEAYRKNYLYLDFFLILVRIRQWVLITEECPIIDIGCGSGQLAHYFRDQGLINYTGIDFSEEALKVARSFSNQKFIQHDISNGLQSIISDVKKDESQNIIFIATEVLEHINEDIKLIEELPSGSHFMFSVPAFDDDGHVRFFPNSKDVVTRYQNKLEFLDKTQIDQHFIYNTIVKERKPLNVIY